MTLAELTKLVFEVDNRRGGCCVEVMAINVPGEIPDHKLYAIVTVGLKELQRIVHSEEELKQTLEAQR